MAHTWVADDRLQHRYLIFTEDGSSSGEARFQVPIEPDDFIVTGNGRRHRVVDIVPVSRDSQFEGFLVVQAASAAADEKPGR
jgi:hypothetical protein